MNPLRHLKKLSKKLMNHLKNDESESDESVEYVENDHHPFPNQLPLKKAISVQSPKQSKNSFLPAPPLTQTHNNNNNNIAKNTNVNVPSLHPTQINSYSNYSSNSRVSSTAPAAKIIIEHGTHAQSLNHTFQQNAKLQASIKALKNLKSKSDVSSGSPTKKKSSADYPAVIRPDYDVCQVLINHGYEPLKEIAQTLQGTIWTAKDHHRKVPSYDDTREEVNLMTNEHFGKRVIIKITNKDLYSRGITILKNGQEKHVHEDVRKEALILQHLTNQALKKNSASDTAADSDANSNSNFGRHTKSSKYFTHFVEFFEDNWNYFLVQEYGGSDLFQFVIECHELIRKGRLSRKEWRLTVKEMMKQICSLLNWLHNDMRCCHLDISLENMLIKFEDESQERFVNKRVKGNKNIYFQTLSINKNFVIKFCDFGLAEMFGSTAGEKDTTTTNNRQLFQSRKFVGKTRYKAPKVYGKSETFDARKADVYSLGISLFMMVVGAPPYKYPDRRDKEFRLCIVDGNILQLLSNWKRAQFMTPQILRVLEGALQMMEEDRFQVAQMMQESWFQTNGNGNGGGGQPHTRNHRRMNDHGCNNPTKQVRSRSVNGS